MDTIHVSTQSRLTSRLKEGVCYSFIAKPNEPGFCFTPVIKKQNPGGNNLIKTHFIKTGNEVWVKQVFLVCLYWEPQYVWYRYAKKAKKEYIFLYEKEIVSVEEGFLYLLREVGAER